VSGSSIFNARVSFEAAVMFVTWGAVAFVSVIIMHLHLRLQRLERASAPVAGARPYGHFAGNRLDELLAGIAFAIRPRVIVALSKDCASCKRVLAEIASPLWTVPTLVVWTDQTPPVMPVMPACVMVATDGPALAAKLGIRITPFALWADDDGVIEKAAPVNSLSSLGVPQNGSNKPQTEIQLERRF
jgi:hypothetical protein